MRRVTIAQLLLLAAIQICPGRGQTIQSRVVNGQTVTDYDKHPFFAEWRDQFCGGALIHDDLVLTAGHCDNLGELTTDIYFRSIQRNDPTAVHRTIIEHVTHPNFNAQYSTRDYDYMLLKLDRSALVDEYGNPTGVQIIEFNTDPQLPQEKDALWGIGFGQIGESISGMSDVLKDATIYAFDNGKCESQYQQYFESDYMFCSGVEGGGTDTCQGDSGGPIVHQDTGRLVGIVSFGIGCARADYAGVNSRVSAAAEWLVRAICEWSDFPKCNGSYPPTPTPTTETNTNPTTEDNQTVLGSITVTIVYDEYPEEVAWTLTGEGNDATLFFQPWKTADPPASRGTTVRTFDRLTPQIRYSFKIADVQEDGVCCSFGAGSVTLRDDVAGQDLWTNRGNFGPYYQVDFEIDAKTGAAQILDLWDQYQPSTWLDYETMVAPSNEAFWPGRMPVHNVSTIMVNVDTDDYPEETRWTLHHHSTAGDWVEVASWIGQGVPLRELVSMEFAELSRGWYRFIVRDSEGDGICCEFGTGYVSLTGPLAATNGQKGLVWGNDGNFFGMDQVFFLIDSAGYISHTTLTESSVIESRTIAQPEELEETP